MCKIYQVCVKGIERPKSVAEKEQQTFIQHILVVYFYVS